MNNSLIRNVIKKYCPNVKKYVFHKNSVIFTDCNQKKYVAKENNGDILQTYNYLNSRGFGYLPRLEYCDEKGYVYDYVTDVDTPDEQKMNDLVVLVALLHNKTVYHKETSIDEIKEIYENLGFQIENTFNYYDDLITMIEAKVYMSPSEYFLARNISSVFSCLNFCKKELEEWYEITSNNPKTRVVLLHNNLSTDHLIKGDNNYLISWDRSVRGIPIYDFVKLYKTNYDKYDFNYLYQEYTRKFSLLPEEEKLMFIILLIPWKITFSESELSSCVSVRKLCDYLFITDGFYMQTHPNNDEVKSS